MSFYYKRNTGFNHKGVYVIMKYYLFLFCLFATSSSLAMLGDDENTGPYSSSQSLTPSLQHPSSSFSTPYYRTDAPGFPSIGLGLRILNSPLEFDAILQNPGSIISELKFNFTPTAKQLFLLIKQLPSLRFLDLSGTDVTDDDIGPLAPLENLEYLDLSSTNVRNVKAVFNRRGQENAISESENNILHLHSHPKLSINLQYTLKNSSEPTSTTDVELKWDMFSHQFRLGDNIEEVESASIRTPEELYTILNHPSAQRVRGLELLFPATLKHIQHIINRFNMSNLTILGLAHSTIKDVSILEELEGLRLLDLSFTELKDISSLAKFKKLCVLLLNNTDVKDLSPLAGLKELRDLYLNNTAIQDVLPLANLGLESLEIKNTAVTNLLPLCDGNKMKIYTNIGRIFNGGKPLREASRHLEEYRGNIHLSLFERLWLKFSPEFELNLSLL